MTVNSIYETPKVLQEYVLQQRGLNAVSYSDSGTRLRREALEALRSKWEALVDRSSFGTLNDLMGIKLASNGRLVVTAQADHTYRDGALIAVPYRFINKPLIEKFLGEYIDWLMVDTEERDGIVRSMTFRPKPEVSPLRVRAFAQAVHEAKEQLGALIGGSTGQTPSLVIAGRETYIDSTYVTGVQLHQLYWVLAIAKELSTNLMPLMRAALRVSRPDTSVEVVKRDTSAAFDVFFEKRQTELRAKATKRKSIENLPVIFPADTITPRTWGIEIEAAGARGIDAPAADWDRKGDGSLRSAYGNGQRDPLSCPDHIHDEDDDGYEDPEYCDWYNEQDFEEEEEYGYGSRSDTAEFVSPILNTAGSTPLKNLLRELSTQPQNDSAGVHVHVDASDLTARNVGALVFAYSVIEPIIEQAYFRNRRNYCKERSAKDVLSVVKSSKTPGIRKSYRDGNDGATTMYYGERYSSVNLNALEAHGTVEFRAMGPVYRYDHLIKWALFCREMVTVAKLNLPAKVWTSIKDWRDLEKVLMKYGTELKANEVRKIEADMEALSKTTGAVLVNA